MQSLTVNGIEIPFPDMPFTWTLNDISTEDSGRDMNGIMDKDEVAKKVTLDCTWSFRSAEDTSKLLKSVKPNTFVDLCYPDPMEGEYATRTFYTGDVSCELAVDTDNEMRWTTKFTFIEQ